MPIYTDAGRRIVKIPMMPKGVEHLITCSTPISLTFVKIPMMPKGVEHPILASAE